MEKKINRKFLGGLILVGLLLLLAVPVLAQGIVPCGHDKACTLCDLIVGIKRLFDYGIKIIAVITIACATFAGVMYVVSSGNENAMKSAKAFLSASLIGLAVVLGAWVIVNTVITVLMPTKNDLGVGKTWSNFGNINCEGSGSSSSSATSTNTSNADLAGQACGASGRGKCFKGASVVAVCPAGYSATLGSPTNSCPSTYNCCEVNGTPASSTGRCGINNVGECKAGVVSCPSGWTSTMGNPTNPCASGSKCCVKDGESSEICRKPFSTIEGKCFYGMNSCPVGWDHPWFATCSASQSICCVKQ